MFTTERCALALLAAGILSAQNQTPVFDSASIKPAQTGVRGFSLQPLPGRLSGRNVSLKQLIAAAYRVHDYQVEGGPKWIDSDRYDLEAKAPDAAVPPGERQLMVMLQHLLAERFHLSVVSETKEQQVYILEPARNGPKVQHTRDTTVPVFFRVVQRHQVTSTNAPLEHLVETLAWILGRPVIDKTGIEGPMDYQLEWAPDDIQLRSDESPVQTDGSLPSLGSALQEVLGLRLVSQKGPVEIVSVQSAAQPAAN